MPPRLRVFLFETFGHGNELCRRQVRYANMIHYCSTPCRLAADDVAARRLRLVLAVDAMVQVDQSFVFLVCVVAAVE